MGKFKTEEEKRTLRKNLGKRRGHIHVRHEGEMAKNKENVKA